MALWDLLTSTKRPESSTAVCSRDEAKKRILDVNRPTAPLQIVEGSEEGVDLIAEWKGVDAQWYEIFAKAGLEKVFRIYLKLDEDARECVARTTSTRCPDLGVCRAWKRP